ncbi:hypothetical protein MY4038_010321 [Beauveria bassiana]|uniref:Uncharacterized protein n=1 Tax=Beauveria bassiana TaxID=176275 RepID=A0A2N6NHC2_BEABA|nr:hypothetical protein BM221_007609 [Beauveria bassiana]
MLKNLALIALVGTAHAAIVKIYHDRNCQVEAGERNVWDNTCAPTGSWSSFKIVYNGGATQKIRGHHANNCWETSVCTRAIASDTCYDCNKGDTSCNALGSFSVDC